MATATNDMLAIREQARRKEELPLLVGRGISATVTRMGTTWDALVRRLSLPLVDNVSYEEYRDLSRDDKLARKSAAGYYVPADCASRHRSDAEVSSRWCCWVDVEGGNAPIEQVLSPLQAAGVEVFWHSTRSHHPAVDRRYRLWVPSLDDLDAYTHGRLTGWLCDRLEAAGVAVDRKASTVFSQPAFQPVVGADVPYEYGLVPGRWISLADLGAGAGTSAPPGEGADGALLEAAVAEADRTERRQAAMELPKSALFNALHLLGMVKGRETPGRWKIVCPNAHHHSDPEDDTAFYFEAHHGGFSGEGVKCHHAHCTHVDALHTKLLLGVRDEEVEAREQASAAARLEPGVLPDLDRLNLQPRPWIVPGVLLKGYMSIVHAPGGTAKSTWALMQAAGVACGVDLTGRGLAVRGPGAVPVSGSEGGAGLRVWIINNEDDEDEMLRRLLAVAKHHNLDWRTLQANLHITSGYREPLVLARERVLEGGQRKIDGTEWAHAVVREIRRLGVQVLVVDPVVSTHALNENDNQQMNALMSVYRAICDRTGVAVLMVAHDRKGGKDEEGGGAGGGTDFMRGASAVRDAARITMRMARMNKKEADALGIAEEDMRFWVQMYDGKKNFAPPAAGSEWFRLVGVDLGQGDEVAVLERVPAGEVARIKEEAEAAAREGAGERAKESVAAAMAAVVETLVEDGVPDETTPGCLLMPKTNVIDRTVDRLAGTQFAMKDRTLRRHMDAYLSGEATRWKGYEGRGEWLLWTRPEGRQVLLFGTPVVIGPS